MYRAWPATSSVELKALPQLENLKQEFGINLLVYYINLMIEEIADWAESAIGVSISGIKTTPEAGKLCLRRASLRLRPKICLWWVLNPLLIRGVHFLPPYTLMVIKNNATRNQ